MTIQNCRWEINRAELSSDEVCKSNFKKHRCKHEHKDDNEKHDLFSIGAVVRKKKNSSSAASTRPLELESSSPKESDEDQL